MNTSSTAPETGSTQTLPEPSTSVEFKTPGLARRLACFVYEGVLLFGLVMIAGYLYSSLTQQHHALSGRHGLQAFLFVVLGIYFVWFWARSGQTVAMKAWHIRLVDRTGRPLSQRHALMRYALAWMWFAPSLLIAHSVGLRSGGEFFAILVAWVLAYAAFARLQPNRQFWHDWLCRTQLIDWRPGCRPPDLDPGVKASAPQQE
jgi:uncharacterized RDD family membrane protein YckC